ncbi:MAG: ATP-binding cassette domain-containing protein, partial [Paludibacteraceae bacterium]|nr:ATP-binding cassette domain-containing protein [Paludibacteraceae bacterium]
MMVAREMNNRFPPKDNVVGEQVLLQVQDMSTVYAPKLHNVSFEVRAGEILGIGGLVGAGRTEVLESILGMRKRESGKVIVC